MKISHPAPQPEHVPICCVPPSEDVEIILSHLLSIFLLNLLCCFLSVLENWDSVAEVIVRSHEPRASVRKGMFRDLWTFYL